MELEWLKFCRLRLRYEVEDFASSIDENLGRMMIHSPESIGKYADVEENELNSSYEILKFYSAGITSNEVWEIFIDNRDLSVNKFQDLSCRPHFKM